MTEPDDFVKASKYDDAGQRHNHAVFIQQLRTRPLLAVAVAVFFIAAGVGVLLVPNRRESPVWIVAVLAFGMAAYLLAATFRHRRDR